MVDALQQSGYHAVEVAGGGRISLVSSEQKKKNSSLDSAMDSGRQIIRYRPRLSLLILLGTRILNC